MTINLGDSKTCTLTYNDNASGTVAGASTTATPDPGVSGDTNNGEVLGATNTLPETGFSGVDRMVMSFFATLLATGVFMILMSTGVLPKKLLSRLS